MANNEPMTDERLAEIDAYWNLIYHGYYMPDIPEPPDTLHDAICHILELRVEVDRLRAREQALAAENAAMRPVVEAVAKLAARETAENPIYSRDLVLHSDDINVLWLREQARAFVAAHPATATGEAESEVE